MERHDVVVVGGGPVGLSLALGLARRGVDVLVLEKDAETAEHSRAPAIWPATQEILGGLGTMGRFEEEGILVPCIELWDVDREGVLLRLPIDELQDETPYARLLILPQARTERLLYQAIRDTTKAEVRFSAEAVALVPGPAGVEVQYRYGEEDRCVQGRFVAGCDGAHSMVRDTLGATFDGVTYDMRAALADIAPVQDEPYRFPRLTTDPNLAVAIRMGSRLWRLILPFWERGEPRTLDERVDEAVEHLFPDVAYETVWQSEFRLHRRVSSRWVDGRVVLAGDAAHLNSPVGGEGMNAGIMDAAALTQALTEALQEDDTRPLERYARERRAVVEQNVNRFTDILTRLLLLAAGRLFRPMLRFVNLLLHVSPLRRYVLRRVAMLNT